MSNKWLRFTLLLLFGVIALSSAYVVKNDKTNSAIMARYDLSGYHQIYLPAQVKTASAYKELVTLVKGVSQTTEAPFIFRLTYTGFENDGKGKVNYAASINKVTFYQTDYKRSAPQSYVPHGVQTTFLTHPMTNIDEEQMRAFDFFVADKNLTPTLEKLTTTLNQQFHLKLTSKDLLTVPANTQSMFLLDTNADLTLFINVSFIFYTLFLFVWLVENNKKVAILRLNGVSGLRISNSLFLREFAVAVGVSFMIGSVGILQSFSLDYVRSLALFVGITLAINYLAILLVSRYSLVNQINNRTFLKGSHILLYVAKILIFTVSVGTTLDSTNMLNNTLKLNFNPKLDNYGVLYPQVLGDVSDIQTFPNFWYTFQYAEKNGALFAQQSQLGTSHIQPLQINSNYLQKNTILDAKGKRVSIRSDDPDGVVLIADNQKSQVQSIKNYYATQGKYSGFKNSKIDYYFIRSNQTVPLYQADTSPQFTGGFPTTRPTIIEVYTAANASQSFTSTDLSTGNPYMLLFPIKGSLTETYQKILPALQADALATTTPSFIPANDVPAANVWMTVGSVSEDIFTNAFAFVLFVLMVFSTTSFYFRVYKQKIAILRFQGVSWLRTYRQLFIIEGVQYVYCFVFLMFNGYSLIIFELFLLYLMIEAFIVVSMLRRLEKNSLLGVLKGE